MPEVSRRLIGKNSRRLSKNYVDKNQDVQLYCFATVATVAK